jgi:hypothetical protein
MTKSVMTKETSVCCNQSSASMPSAAPMTV